MTAIIQQPITISYDEEYETAVMKVKDTIWYFVTNFELYNVGERRRTLENILDIRIALSLPFARVKEQYATYPSMVEAHALVSWGEWTHLGLYCQIEDAKILQDFLYDTGELECKNSNIDR